MIGVIKGTMRQKKEVNGLPLPIASYKANMKAPIRSLKVAITATQSGSGTPAPDNIRPISGWSSVNVVDMSDITNIDYFRGLLNGTYGFVDLGTLNWNKTTGWGSSGNVTMFAPRANSRLLDAKGASGNDSLANIICPIFQTATRNQLYNSVVTNGVNLTDLGYVQIIPTTEYVDATAFKTAMSGVYLIYELATATTPTITPTQFNTLLNAFSIDGWCVNIALGDTYYGGSLDVTTGVLTVTNKYKQIPPENLGISVATITYVTGDMKSGNALAGLCDTFKTVNSSGNYGVRFGANNNTIYFYNLMNNIPEITDLDTAKQWFTEHPVHVCYELRIPITVQLTPTQIEQLLGTNNVFADTGDVEELKYIDRQVYYGR